VFHHSNYQHPIDLDVIVVVVVAAAAVVVAAVDLKKHLDL